MRTLTIIRPLGSGAFGTVYLASLEAGRGFSREVAVKVLRSGRDDRFVRRMRDEARLLGLLNDDHVIEVIELVRLGGRDAVVMEYVEGVDLLTALQAGHLLPLRALAELGAVVAGTLHRAHRARHPQTGEPLNVIHRDVKPANVMVTVRGSVKLLDFGVARARFESRESYTGQLVLGTLNYMAPEYMLRGEVSPAVDLYGLGVTLWEAATGQTFGAPRVREEDFAAQLETALGRLPGEAAPLVPLLRRLLAREPAERPQGDEVERELLAMADASRGEGLRSWASRVVPGLLERRSMEAEDLVGLAGQRFSLDADEEGAAAGPGPGEQAAIRPEGLPGPATAGPAPRESFPRGAGAPTAPDSPAAGNAPTSPDSPAAGNAPTAPDSPAAGNAPTAPDSSGRAPAADGLPTGSRPRGSALEHGSSPAGSGETSPRNPAATARRSRLPLGCLLLAGLLAGALLGLALLLVLFALLDS